MSFCFVCFSEETNWGFFYYVIQFLGNAFERRILDGLHKLRLTKAYLYYCEIYQMVKKGKSNSGKIISMYQLETAKLRKYEKQKKQTKTKEKKRLKLP